MTSFRPPPRKPAVQVNARIPADIYERLQSLANATDATRTDLIAHFIALGVEGLEAELAKRQR